MRWAGPSLSGDVAHLGQISSQVETAAGAEGAGVLLWGNSLVGDGIDADRLRQGLIGSGIERAAVAKVNPDGTTPVEWHFLLRQHLGETGSDLGLLVVGFGPGHLVDRSPRENLPRMALHHVRAADVRGFLREHLTSLEDRAAFLAHRTLHALAFGERVQPRALDLIIPGYRESAPILLAGRGGAPERVAAAPLPEGRERSLRYLAALVDEAARSSAPLVLLPMPQPFEWALFLEEVELLERCNVRVLDLLDQARYPEDWFPDGTHLSAQGRDAFTDLLAPHLSRLLLEPAGALVPSPCPVERP
jgi:hypothetical protein